MVSFLRCAWLPLAALAAGCTDVAVEPDGGGGSGPVGGSDLGGASSGGGGSAPASTIDIEVIDERGLPAAGLEVLSHSAEGALVARAVTAADGRAVIELPTGGLASVLFDRHNEVIEGEERSIQSVALPPGRQSLRFVAYESLPPEDDGPAMGPVLIDYGPLDTGAGEAFFFQASCAQDLNVDWPTATALVIEDYRGCPGSDVFDVYASRVYFEGPNTTVTDTAVISGVPFTPGEGVELAFEWVPVETSDTTWQVEGISGSASARASAWRINTAPYLLLGDVITQPAADLFEGTITQQTTTLPADVQCVTLNVEQNGEVCTSHQRKVCGNAAPPDIDWPLGRLAVPTLDSSQTAWSTAEGELGDYFEVRRSAPASDGAYVTWSLQVAIDVSSRPAALELPEDLVEHYGSLEDESAGVFVNNVDIDGVSGFDAVLDAHGATPLLPGGRPITRESVHRRPCPD